MLTQRQLGHWFFIAAMAMNLVACSSRQQPAPVSSVYTGKTVYDFTPSSLNQQQAYQVQRGETLYSIAFRADLDVNELARLNGLSAPYTIYPGQTIKLKPTKVASRGTNNTSSRSNGNKESPKISTNGLTKPVAKPPAKRYVDAKAQQKQQKKQPPKPASWSSSEAQVASADIRWQWPSTANVSSEFSLQELGNKGLDFSGQRGDPIVAAAAGKVVYVGNALRGYGQLIILKHNDDYITAYAHNDKLLVKEQQWVDAGQVIAQMGDTGSDTVKLHFELRFRGKSVNPRHYLPKSR
ncbi:peptidoglycan DD-metalloendopeptidase family protein [Idiomarina xiamenensis]|uniref:Lipoprotein NlpD n=1 Tax=Idiomarina xiamenensis 10-D-4 TaxID=740709 RepID=K2KDJ1_9GAMM|nr:peptidoglycan DD-metalloendopeptidase family protein [Idiomarina xiamenensis]EKE84787.1 lipoprotein NlpD [Idiomarina xiamenensis 10-D-4]